MQRTPARNSFYRSTKLTYSLCAHSGLIGATNMPEVYCKFVQYPIQSLNRRRLLSLCFRYPSFGEKKNLKNLQIDNLRSKLFSARDFWKKAFISGNRCSTKIFRGRSTAIRTQKFIINRKVRKS